MLPDSTDVSQIVIPPITLEWSAWFSWEALILDARRKDTGVRVPSTSGVYEAKHSASEERLTIGKASDLRLRIKQGLVKGKSPHSSGGGIRATEDMSEIVVRWAVTERPSAVEEELHKRYKAQFGCLPIYTKRT